MAAWSVATLMCAESAVENLQRVAVPSEQRAREQRMIFNGLGKRLTLHSPWANCCEPDPGCVRVPGPTALKSVGEDCFKTGSDSITQLLSEPIVATLSHDVRGNELDAFALLAERSVMERSLRRPDKCRRPLQKLRRETEPRLAAGVPRLPRIFLRKRSQTDFLHTMRACSLVRPQPSCRQGLQSAVQ
jgi:hypothetical protein